MSLKSTQYSLLASSLWLFVPLCNTCTYDWCKEGWIGDSEGWWGWDPGDSWEWRKEPTIIGLLVASTVMSPKPLISPLSVHMQRERERGPKHQQTSGRQEKFSILRIQGYWKHASKPTFFLCYWCSTFVDKSLVFTLHSLACQLYSYATDLTRSLHLY